MTLRLRMIVVCVILVLYISIVYLVRKKELDLRYAFGWIIPGFVIILLAVWPQMLEKISVLVGIFDPVNMLFFFGFCLSMCIIFSLTIAISHLSDKVKRLAQELAILRRQIYENSREEKWPEERTPEKSWIENQIEN